MVNILIIIDNSRTNKYSAAIYYDRTTSTYRHIDRVSTMKELIKGIILSIETNKGEGYDDVINIRTLTIAKPIKNTGLRLFVINKSPVFSNTNITSVALNQFNRTTDTNIYMSGVISIQEHADIQGEGEEGSGYRSDIVRIGKNSIYVAGGSDTNRSFGNNIRIGYLGFAKSHHQVTQITTELNKYLHHKLNVSYIDMSFNSETNSLYQLTKYCPLEELEEIVDTDKRGSMFRIRDVLETLYRNQPPTQNIGRFQVGTQ